MLRFLIVLFVAALPASLTAQTNGRHSIGLDVKVIRSGATTKRSQAAHTDRSSRIRTTKTVIFERQKSGLLDLEISLRNFGRSPEAVQVDWFFFARDVRGGNLHVHSEGAESQVLPPGAGRKLEAQASRALSTVAKRWQFDRIQTTTSVIEAPVSAESAKSGIKLAGWLVRVRANGTVLRFKASAGEFERYAEDRDLQELARP